MSGGAGTRLWPTSMDARPKQFHAFGGTRTLFQETVLRASGTHAGLTFGPPIILCNARHADLIDAELAAIGVSPSAIALEPEGRNTAATAAVAAALAREVDPGSPVLLLPADHRIGDADAFHATLARAAPFADQHIVTFGVSPTRAETGYGYIEAGAVLGDGVHAIVRFHEKPNEALATDYVARGYFWNAGLFLFDPQLMLDEFAAAPGILDGALAALKASRRDGHRVTLDAPLFAAIESAPLDIAVMQKTRRGAVAPCSMDWADIGSWHEVWRLSAKDEQGNAVSGEALTEGARGCLIMSDGPRVAALGVEDLVIIVNGDDILIAPRARAQDVKVLAERAKAQR